MNLDLGLQVVKNKKTGQTFVFIDDTSAINIKVINPAGLELEVPSVLFEEKRSIGAFELQKELSELQIKKVNSLKPARKKASAATTTRSRKKASKTSRVKKNLKIGLGAEWSSDQLTFYKHKIEPLDPGQWFIVNVEGHGRIKMTKDQFGAEFMDVVLHESYWKNGSFSYSRFPEKANKFIED